MQKKNMQLVYCILLIIFKNFFSLSEALHIVHFRTITNEMKRMIQNAEYPSDDPRKIHDLTSRQEICNEVLTVARQYTILNSHINENTIPKAKPSLADYNFQRIRSQSEEALPFDQEIAYYKDHGQWKVHTLPLIKCLDRRKENLYVGFDQDEERAYFVQRMKFTAGKVVYRWTALIETCGRYENLFSGPRMAERLFDHFVTQMREAADKKKNDKPRMSVCDLSLVEHGRLCSAISEGLGVRLSPNELSAHNYINTGQKRCSGKEISVSDEEMISAKVIQCTLNRNRERPQFYVLNDPDVQGAAYILKRDPEKLHGLKMIARMGHLKVLQEFKPKEKTKRGGKNVLRIS